MSYTDLEAERERREILTQNLSDALEAISRKLKNNVLIPRALLEEMLHERGGSWSLPQVIAQLQGLGEHTLARVLMRFVERLRAARGNTE